MYRYAADSLNYWLPDKSLVIADINSSARPSAPGPTMARLVAATRARVDRDEKESDNKKLKLNKIYYYFYLHID